MLKKMVVSAVLCVCMAVGLVGFSYATDDTKGPEEITLVNVDSKKPKPAVFPHKKHQETLKCGECHHGMDADGNQTAYVEGQEIGKCASCHNSEKLAGKTVTNEASKKPLDLDTLKGAGHGNCLACHKKTDKKELAKCSVCHPKNK